jgi:hypothetical protein
MKLSSLFSLNAQDFLKGLIMAAGGAVFGVIYSWVNAGIFTFDWTIIWHTSVAAIVVYLSKNFFTPTPTTIEVDKTKTAVVDVTPVL